MRILAPCVASLGLLAVLQAAMARAQSTYLGMDRNDYPGEANMQLLRKTFAFTGYWLNRPPGADRNSWEGKRRPLQAMGFGFVLLFNGREYKELEASGDAAGVGSRDAAKAVHAAESEGFPKRAILFLDQEQGGRMLPEQRAYIHAWIDGVVKGGYRAGVYCSGIPFRESSTVSVVTAVDIRDHAGGREYTSLSATITVAHRPDVRFRASRPNQQQVVLRLPKFGSMHNPRDVRK